jgi:predicted double-glycine peptidase
LGFENQQGREPMHNPRRNLRFINLHITRQTYDFDCGAKALQTVMAYYGVDVREDKLLRELGSNNNGTAVEKMVSIANRYGFEVKTHEYLTLAGLKKYIKEGIPVIVLLQAWAERYMTLKDWREDDADGHYAIVIGYQRKVLIFEDPSSFRRTWLRETEFLARWHDVDPENDKRYEQFGMVLLGKDAGRHLLEHMG